MPFLREKECQQKKREHKQQNGLHQPREAFKEAVGRPEVQRSVQVIAVAQVQAAIRKKAGIGGISEGNVKGAHYQRQGGFSGRDVQVVDASNLLIVLRGVSEI